MKKKIGLLLACITASAMVFGGCGNDKEKQEKEPTQKMEETAFSSEDGLPPLEQGIKDLYSGAQMAYEGISMGGMSVDSEQTIQKNDYTYYKVNDSRFTTYEEYKTYLSGYFTKEFAEKGILGGDNIMFTQDEKGNLYCLSAGRGANILYAGHVFHQPEETAEGITLTATVYYSNSNEAYEGDLFYTTPENSEDFTTQDFAFHLVEEDGQWKFNDFTLFY